MKKYIELELWCLKPLSTRFQLYRVSVLLVEETKPRSEQLFDENKKLYFSRVTIQLVQSPVPLFRLLLILDNISL